MVWLISKSNVWLLMLFVKLCSINNLTIWLKFLRFKTFSIAPNGQQHEPTKIFTTRHWELKKEWKNDKYIDIYSILCVWKRVKIVCERFLFILFLHICRQSLLCSHNLSFDVRANRNASNQLICSSSFLSGILNTYSLPSSPLVSEKPSGLAIGAQANDEPRNSITHWGSLEVDVLKSNKKWALSGVFKK